MQHPAADMDADPPTTTTTIPADVRRRIGIILGMLNDELAAEARDETARLDLIELLWKSLGYKHKQDAIRAIKKTLIEGILTRNFQ